MPKRKKSVQKEKEARKKELRSSLKIKAKNAEEKEDEKKAKQASTKSRELNDIINYAGI